MVCHGILASGRNWRAFARAIVDRQPDLRVILVDLRNHGDSSGANGPHTVQQCAVDLMNLAKHLSVQPEIVIGHSFSGKVVLSYVKALPPGLCHAWVLDCPPGRTVAPAATEVVAVLKTLHTIAQPLDRRNQLITLLTAAGFSTSIAQWMTTNLKRTDEGLVWRFNLPAVQEMLADYFERDFWHFLNQENHTINIHLVQASKSDRWRDEEMARLKTIRSTSVHLHSLSDAGHWVHVDNPLGLLEMLMPSLT